MSRTDSTGGMTVAVSHIGLCVSDLERSLRFYTEGLGFEMAEGWDITGPLARLAEIDGEMLCRSQMIVMGSAKLELLGWTTPDVELGGTVLESTRLRVPMPDGPMDVLFVADPDGVRVELIEHHTNPRSDGPTQ